MIKRYGLLTAGVVLLAAVLFFGGVAQPASAQQVTREGTSYYNVNVRTAPGTNRPIIDVIPANAEFVAIGRNEENSWVQVEYEDTVGWSAAWLFVFDHDTIDLPVTTDVEAPLATDSGPFDTLIPFNMNMRAAPSVHSNVVTEIPFLSGVEAIARDTTSSWVLVEYSDMSGWLALWKIVLLGDVEALPVVEGGFSGTSTATTTQPPAASGEITVSAPYTLNMRAQPDVNAALAGELPFGIAVPAIGRNEGNNWIQVTHEGVNGWVAAWLVSASSNTVALPVTSTSEAVTSHIGDINGQAVYNAIIRNKPGEIYATIGQIPAGQTALLEARTADSAWVRVAYQDVEGWAATWLFLANADINNLPVETPQP